MISAERERATATRIISGSFPFSDCMIVLICAIAYTLMQDVASARNGGNAPT